MNPNVVMGNGIKYALRDEEGKTQADEKLEWELGVHSGLTLEVTGASPRSGMTVGWSELLCLLFGFHGIDSF